MRTKAAQESYLTLDQYKPNDAESFRYFGSDKRLYYLSDAINSLREFLEVHAEDGGVDSVDPYDHNLHTLCEHVLALDKDAIIIVAVRDGIYHISEEVCLKVKAKVSTY